MGKINRSSKRSKVIRSNPTGFPEFTEIQRDDSLSTAKEEDLLPVIRNMVREGVDAKTRKMLIHIIGQISYKRGCLEKVVAELKTWENRIFVAGCAKEIIAVHKSYEKFSALSSQQAHNYIVKNLGGIAVKGVAEPVR